MLTPSIKTAYLLNGTQFIFMLQTDPSANYNFNFINSSAIAG